MKYLENVKSHHVLIVVFFAALIAGYHFRHRIAEAHDRWRGRRRAELHNSFLDDFEQGLNSDTFSITSNISTNDPRFGLLVGAKDQIKKIMDEDGVSFDEARLRYTQSELNRNDVDSDGLPRDPRLVTF